MPLHYSRAEVLLVSLRPDPVLADTLPGKVQACLAAGRPILGMVEGAAAEVIQTAGAGRVTQPGKVASLEAAVLDLMNCSSADLDAMGKSGRTFYLKHFSKKTCLEHLTSELGLHLMPKKGA